MQRTINKITDECRELLDETEMCLLSQDALDDPAMMRVVAILLAVRRRLQVAKEAVIAAIDAADLAEREKKKKNARLLAVSA